jgi:hypothetical protein
MQRRRAISTFAPSAFEPAVVIVDPCSPVSAFIASRSTVAVLMLDIVTDGRRTDHC